MNGYKAFFKGREIEVRAETSYRAQLEAAKVLKVKDKDRHQITVVLCEKADGESVVHVAAD